MAAHLPWKPHLMGEYDYATGNTHRNAQRIGTFDQQYPSNHNAFGLVDLFGFQNIKQYRLNMDLNPYRELTLLFQGESLHAATKFDGLYSSAGSPFVNAPQLASRAITSAQDLMRQPNTSFTSTSLFRLVWVISSRARS